MKRLYSFFRNFLSNFVENRKAIYAVLTPALIFAVGIIVLVVLSNNSDGNKKGTEIMINADLYSSKSYSSNTQSEADGSYNTPSKSGISSDTSKFNTDSSRDNTSVSKAKSEIDTDGKECETCQKIMYDKNDGKQWFTQYQSFSVRGVPLADTNMRAEAYAFYSDMSYTVQLVFKNSVLIYPEKSNSAEYYINKLESEFNGYKFNILNVDSSGMISLEAELYGEPQRGTYTVSHEKSGEVLNLSDGQTLYYRGGYLCGSVKPSDVVLVLENPDNYKW